MDSLGRFAERRHTPVAIGLQPFAQVAAAETIRHLRIGHGCHPNDVAINHAFVTTLARLAEG